MVAAVSTAAIVSGDEVRAERENRIWQEVPAKSQVLLIMGYSKLKLKKKKS